MSVAPYLPLLSLFQLLQVSQKGLKENCSSPSVGLPFEGPLGPLRALEVRKVVA